MQCTIPKCQGNTKVLETRASDDGTKRRRRVCLKCDHRFSTKETLLQDGSVFVRCEIEVKGSEDYFDKPVFRAVGEG